MAPAIRQTPPTAQAHARLRLRTGLVLIGAALLLWAFAASLFSVDVTQYGVVSRFGRVLRVVEEPGLHLKVPFDNVVRLDRRLTFSRPAQAEYLTIDKRNVVIETLATWRIADPRRFLATLATRADADLRLADVVIAEVGAVLGKYPASLLIAPDADAARFRRIVSEIRGRAAEFARDAYGIQIVDVELLHLTLPEQNREHVFERMKAERGKMAKENRTAGELQAKKIIAEADHERTRIEADSYEETQRLRAEGDAEASRIYAAAFSQNPAFYKFLRTLQAYERFLDENTTLFLPADAEVLRMLRPELRHGAKEPSGRAAVAVTAKPREPAPALSVAGPGKPGAGSAPPADLSPRADPEPR
jgi:modulator of FtsH protease HflC